MGNVNKAYVTNVDITSESDLQRLKESMVSVFQNNKTDLKFHCADVYSCCDGPFTDTLEFEEGDDPRVPKLSQRLNLDPEFIEAHSPGRVVGVTLEEVADNLITYLKSGLCMNYVIWRENHNLEETMLELNLNISSKDKPLGVHHDPKDPFDAKEYTFI